MANAQNGLEETLTKLADALGGSGAPAAPTAIVSGTAQASDAAAAFAATAEKLGATEKDQADALSLNTEALTKSIEGNSKEDAASVAGDAYKSVVSPVVRGFIGLFTGGGDDSAPAPLTPYTAPEAVRFEGDFYRSGNVTDWGSSELANSETPVATNTQITVQVNAMDSQSFLDHSQDIARAVRQAMLNSNSLNDVVSEL